MKATIPLLCAGLALLAATPAAAELQARLMFELPGALGTDATANLNHAAVVNGPEYDPEGVSGGGIRFTRNTDPGGLQQYLQWIGASNPVVKSLEEDFSISFWIRSTEGGMLFWSRPPFSPSNGFYLDSTPWDLTRFETEAVFWGNSTLWGTTDIHDGSWHHVVITRKFSGEKELWIDALLENSESHASYTDLSQLDMLLVGAHPDGDFNGFDGTIDEVRIYNHVLTPEEIQRNYDSPADEGTVTGDLPLPDTLFAFADVRSERDGTGNTQWVSFLSILDPYYSGTLPEGTRVDVELANASRETRIYYELGGSSQYVEGSWREGLTDALAQLQDNPWTLTLTPENGSPTTLTFTVSIDPDSVTEADFPPVIVSTPAWQGTVSPQQTWQWQAPSGDWSYHDAWAYTAGEFQGFTFSGTLPEGGNSWTPATPLLAGRNVGFVRYLRTRTDGVSVTNSAGIPGGAELSLNTWATLDFTVIGTAPEVPDNFTMMRPAGAPAGTFDLGWTVTAAAPDDLSRVEFSSDLVAWTPVEQLAGAAITRETSPGGTVRARIAFQGGEPARAFFRFRPAD